MTNTEKSGAGQKLFTQEELNAIVKERLNRQNRKHEEQIAALESQFDETLTAALASGGKVQPEVEEDDGENEVENATTEDRSLSNNEREVIVPNLERRDDELTKLRSENAELQRAQRESEKRAAILAAASKLDFFDVAEVALLTDSAVTWDSTTQAWVVKEDGVTKMNEDLKPMSLEEFFSGWAAARPHLVKSQIKGGAGSTLNAGVGRPMPRSKADFRSVAEKCDFIKTRGLPAFEQLATN